MSYNSVMELAQNPEVGKMFLLAYARYVKNIFFLNKFD